VTPLINAVSTVMLVASMVLVSASVLLQRRRDASVTHDLRLEGRTTQG
jgi:ABC-type spermidine/putrescine transport system permease subunit II